MITPANFRRAESRFWLLRYRLRTPVYSKGD